MRLRFSFIQQVIIVLVVVSVVLMPDIFVYAQEDGTQFAHTFSQFIQLIVSFLSRGWMIFAVLAGKLLTNEFVYGEFIHLDQALRKLRNIMKNFANFALGFLFLWTIFQYFWQKGELGALVKKIGGFVLAGIGIQMSWFMVGAVLDVSTILMSSMSAFPSLIISQDTQIQATIQNQMITIPKQTTYYFDRDGTQNPLEHLYDQVVNESTTETGTIELNKFIDTIMPSPNSISGPLIYLGLSVFHVQDYLQLTDNTARVDISDAVAVLLLKFGVLILFTFFLLIMIAANVLRVLYLRLFISVSPFMILFYVMEKLEISTESVKTENTIWVSVQDALKLIFMPVVYVTFMGLGLIMIITMQKILVNNENAGIFVNDATQISNNKISVLNSSITIEGDVFAGARDDVANTTVDMLLMAFALMILGALVYLSVEMSGPSFVKSKMQAFRSTATDAALATAKIGNVTLGSLVGTNTSQSALGNLKDSFKTAYNKDDKDRSTNLKDDINTMLGLAEGLSAGDKRKLDDAFDKLLSDNSNADQALFAFKQSLESHRGYDARNTTVADADIYPYIDKFFKGVNNKKLKQILGTGIEINKTENQSLESYVASLGQSDRTKVLSAIYKTFFKAQDKSITTIDQFKKIIIKPPKKNN